MNAVRLMFRASAIGLVSTLWFPMPALPQATKAGVVTTVQGTATIARSTAPQPMPLKFKDDVFVQDKIVTGDSSLVRILLGGKAVVTVREHSALTIHETRTTSTIEISSGKIALAVAKSRLKPGESVQIKTPNAMAGIRGTMVVADVAEPVLIGGSVTTRFTLLTGIVDVTRLDAGTGRPTGRPVMLHPLQTIVVTGHTPPGAARAISRAEAQKIASDYEVSLPTPPPATNTEVMERQINLALQHAAALTVGPSGTGGGNANGNGDAEGNGEGENNGSGKSKGNSKDKANRKGNGNDDSNSEGKDKSGRENANGNAGSNGGVGGGVRVGGGIGAGSISSGIGIGIGIGIGATVGGSVLSGGIIGGALGDGKQKKSKP